jgi:hypothetical protein
MTTTMTLPSEAQQTIGVAEQPPLPPKTTAQEDLIHAGQRKVNLVWEYTQAFVAGFVVASNMIVAVAQGLGFAREVQFPSILANSLFLVVGFYFSRTNHAAIGGVGAKPSDTYVGR